MSLPLFFKTEVFYSRLIWIHTAVCRPLPKQQGIYHDKSLLTKANNHNYERGTRTQVFIDFNSQILPVSPL